MFSGLSRRLYVGNIIRIRLHFSDGSLMTMNAPVRDMRVYPVGLHHERR